MTRRALAVVLALVPAPAAGQGLAAACSAPLEAYCVRTAQAAEIALSRTAIAAALGNPVPGTASTLGMRLGSMPRFTIAGRFGLARATLPHIATPDDTDDHGASITSFGVDISVGLYSGIALGPTVGGFASVDLLTSLVGITMPGTDGWGGTLHSWGLGARFGVLRESFTAPGLSVSVMRRGFGGVEYGRNSFAVNGGRPPPQGAVGSVLARQNESAYINIDDYSSWSVRAAVGKRMAGIGVTGGIGWDRATADVLLRRQAALGPATTESPGFSADRFTVWGDASFTLLIASAVLDVGWQSGGDEPAAGADYVSRGGLYGALALRLGF